MEFLTDYTVISHLLISCMNSTLTTLPGNLEFCQYLLADSMYLRFLVVVMLLVFYNA